MFGWTVDERMRALISAIEKANEFDPDGLGSASGLAEEATMLYRNYVAGKGLVTRAAINFFRLGLTDIWVFARVKYRVWKALMATYKDLIAMPGLYLLGSGYSLGDTQFIARVAIPPTLYEGFRALADGLAENGILESYEVLISDSPVSVFSLDPSVFDYATGTWKRVSHQVKVNRELTMADKTAVPFDEVDLKILTMLKRSAATSPRAMAAAIGLDVDEVVFHLKQHVLGGGDPAKSMILKYYVDFLEPGLFAPDTVMVYFIADVPKGSNAVLQEFVALPYVSAIWQGSGKVYGLLYGPLQSLYNIAYQLDSIGVESGAEGLRYFVSPWYYWSLFGSLHSPVALESNYKNGKWVFDKDALLGSLVSRISQGMR
ncbi:hypothetical protein PQ610_03525 [Tardisphaera miroshnichenkoae]